MDSDGDGSGTDLPPSVHSDDDIAESESDIEVPSGIASTGDDCISLPSDNASDYDNMTMSGIAGHLLVISS